MAELSDHQRNLKAEFIEKVRKALFFSSQMFFAPSLARPKPKRILGHWH